MEDGDRVEKGFEKGEEGVGRPDAAAVVAAGTRSRRGEIVGLG